MLNNDCFFRCTPIKTILGPHNGLFSRLNTQYYFNHSSCHENSHYYPIRKDFPMNKQTIHLAYARIRNTND